MKKPVNHIKIGVITGSVRTNSYTSKVVQLITKEIESTGAELFVIEPEKLNLPLPGLNGNFPDVEKLKTGIRDVTAIIITVPEYHGGFSSIVKLIIENLGYPSALAGKPIALIGVAAGDNIAVKSLESLASVCTHVGGQLLLSPVSIVNVQKLTDDNEPGEKKDVLQQIKYAATNILNAVYHSLEKEPEPANHKNMNAQVSCS